MFHFCNIYCGKTLFLFLNFSNKNIFFKNRKFTLKVPKSCRPYSPSSDVLWLNYSMYFVTMCNVFLRLPITLKRVSGLSIQAIAMALFASFIFAIKNLRRMHFIKESRGVELTQKTINKLNTEDLLYFIFKLD